MSVKIDKGSALDSVNMTPLIDVVFLLLIFFLVSTKLAEAEQEEFEVPVQLATASEAMPVTVQPREVIVTIDRNGQHYVGGKPKSLPELEVFLEQAETNNPNRTTVIIRADERAAVKPLMDAMNACLKAGIRDYHPVASPVVNEE